MRAAVRDLFAPSLRFKLRRLQSALWEVRHQAWLGFWRGDELRRAAGNRTGLRLHIGCGPVVLPGWLNVDAYPDSPGVLFFDALNPLPLADGSAVRIHCEHFLEHLEFTHAARFLRECRRVLGPGGSMRIVVPDAGKYMSAYARQDSDYFSRLTELGGASPPLETPAMICNQMFRMGGAHEFAWDFETLALVCRKAGFSAVERSSIGKGPDRDQCDGHEWWRAHESLYAEAFADVVALGAIRA